MATRDNFEQRLSQYHKLYIDCFRNLPKEVGQMVWIHPDEIQVEGSGDTFEVHVDDKEWYTKHGTKLAESIRRLGGVYLPFLVGRGIPKGDFRTRNGTEDNSGPLYCDEGRHRLRALRELDWDNKILCLYHPRGFAYENAKYTSQAMEIISRPCPELKIKIPFRAYFTEENIFREQLVLLENFEHLFELPPEQDLIVMKCRSMYDFKVIIYKFARFLSDMFVSYKMLFGKEWPAPQEINEIGYYFPDIPYMNATRTTELSQIRMVEIEIHSNCNRKCPWCPNSFVDRRSQKIEMPQDKFEQIIRELYDKGFNGTFSFSRYQEPLIDTDLLANRIAIIRKYFRNSVKVVFNTNGDFFDGRTLRSIDVDEITVMDYDNKGLDKCRQKILDGNYEILFEEDNYIYFQYKDVEYAIKRVGVYVVDWPKNASINSRGDSIPKDLKVMKWNNDRKPRLKSCWEPQYFIGIDYNGNVVPCCEVRSDIPKHQCMVFGNAFEKSLEEIWNDERYSKFRETMKKGNVDEYPDPCKFCQKCPGRYTRDKPGIMFEERK
jgi:radical SAM protein with 4Fe4S-binding SPASM domain